MLKKTAVLNFIRAKKQGRSFSEIQRFICDMNGLDFDKKNSDGTRRYRGYWCTNLIGYNGILKNNKIQKINNLWVHPNNL